MAWTAPMTAVANAAFTAAQFNTYVRDNLNETAPAKASTAGSIFVGTGTNSIAERIPTNATVAAAETTASSTFVDLATGGPAVTVTTGTKAIVILTAQVTTTSANDGGIMSYAVSGASTIAESVSKSVRLECATTSTAYRASAVLLESGLSSGSNTFTAKYRRISAGTTTFAARELLVIPL